MTGGGGGAGDSQPMRELHSSGGLGTLLGDDHCATRRPMGACSRQGTISASQGSLDILGVIYFREFGICSFPFFLSRRPPTSFPLALAQHGPATPPLHPALATQKTPVSGPQTPTWKASKAPPRRQGIRRLVYRNHIHDYGLVSPRHTLCIHRHLQGPTHRSR